MTTTLEILLGLLVVVVAVSALARRMRFPAPLMLVPAGAVLGYVPGMPAVSPPPDLVLHVFLPLLVYATALDLPWRQFRANLRPIMSLSVGLVFFTTAGVALLAHAVIPGLSWSAAFALGAIISPTDEVAAASVLQRLSLPRRISVILQGEGLVNDVAALTAFRFAVVAAASASFSMPQAAGYFIVTLVAGTLYGYAVGWVALRIRDRLRDTPLEMTVSLVTPFVAYFGPEYFGATGVLATAVAGLVVNAQGPRSISAETRLHATPIWRMIDFWLNGVLFVLLGLQLRAVLGAIPPQREGDYLRAALAVALAAVLLRFLWVYVVAYTPRLWSSRRGDSPAELRSHVFMVSWTGMRGAISLAAAFALPLTLPGGTPFPERELIIFITFGVIALTLVVQGATLPLLIRVLGLDHQGRAERNDEAHLEYEARIGTLDAGIARLDELSRSPGVPAAFAVRYERELRERRQTLQRHGDTIALAGGIARSELATMLEVTEAQREELHRLRAIGMISDDILRHIERDLDEDQMRLQTRAQTLPERRDHLGKPTAGEAE